MSINLMLSLEDWTSDSRYPLLHANPLLRLRFPFFPKATPFLPSISFLREMTGSKGDGGGGGGGGGPCGACKFLRRKCVKGCVFAPYFDSDQGTAHFAAVHKVFGASNASKLLAGIPPHKRLDAVVTLCYEALARVRDPVYGCVAHIFTLQQQV